MDTRIEPAAFAAKYLCNEPSSNIANHIEATPAENHLCITGCVKMCLFLAAWNYSVLPPFPAVSAFAPASSNIVAA